MDWADEQAREIVGSVNSIDDHDTRELLVTVANALRAEREACAAIAESHMQSAWPDSTRSTAARYIADDIRAGRMYQETLH